MAGHGLPGDRRFALALAGIPPPTAPHWLPREQLLTRSRFPRLAQLDTMVEDEHLTIRRRGRVVLSADLGIAHGRSVVSAFFAAFLAGESFGHPRLVEFSEGFGDSPKPRLSVIGTATLDEVERLCGRRIDPAELRVNLVLSGLVPRAEQNWVGHRLHVGEAVLAISGAMDRAILPELLGSTFGHTHLGILAEVVAGGEIRVGDAVWDTADRQSPVPENQARKPGAAAPLGEP